MDANSQNQEAVSDATLEQRSVISVEFPIEFWQSIESLAQKGGVTPEAVISAGTSLYSLALKAKTEHQKMAVIELDQPCITEITGL